MKRYILTGGISSGKSTVVETLSMMGFNIIDADVISKKVFDQNKMYIKEMFSTDLDGVELRHYIANEIFSDPRKKMNLEFFMHPLIRAEMDTLEKSMGVEKYILDIPLYYEKSPKTENDVVILVNTSYENQLDRLMSRDGLTLDEANKRILSQIPNGVKATKADYVIDNMGTKEELIDAVKIMVSHYFGNEV